MLKTELHEAAALFPARSGGGHARRAPEISTGRAVLDVTATTDTDSRSIALDRPLLTAEEVAALLAVPRSSVYEYARRRTDPLPSLLIGRHRRFDRRTGERWLGEQTTLTR